MDVTDIFQLYNGRLVIEGAPAFTTERWQAMELWSTAAAASQVPELIRAVYDAGPGPTALWSAIHEKDETLTSVPGSPAARLMAAAALDHLFTHNGNLDVPAALAVISASFGGRVPADLPTNLTARAVSELDAVADQRRERPDLSEAITKLTAETPISKLVADVGNEMTGEKVVAAMTDMLRVTARALEKLAGETRKVLNLAASQIDQSDEECEVLWFVFGGVSAGASRSFAELSSAEAAFNAAAELADMTGLPIHSQNFKALVGRLNVSPATETIKASVERMSPAWITERVEREPDARLYPIHRMLDRYREFGTSGSAWSKGTEQVLGFAPSMKLDAQELALQFYRELMLKKALSS